MVNKPGKLGAFFDIQSGEGRLVVLLFAHSLLNGWAQSATLSVSYSLFVDAFGAQNLPYRYIAGALLTLLVGLLYGWLARRVGFARLLSANLGVLLLGLVALRFLLDMPMTAWAVAGLAIWNNLVTVFPDLEFWSLAGHLLDVRQAKRLFPPIGLGQVVAMVLGGLLTPWLIGLFGTTNLLLGAAAGLAGSFVLLRLLLRDFHTRLEAPQRQPARRAMGLARLLGDRYLLLIFAFMLLYECAHLFTDNIFVASAALHFPSTDELAGFLGLFGAAAGLGSLLVRSFGVSPLLARYGLTGGLLVWPLVVGTGSVAMVGAGLVFGLGLSFFWAATVTRLAERVLKRSTFQASLQMTYQPLPHHQRVQVQNMNETVIDSIGAVVGGLTLLLLINVAHLNGVWLALIQLILVLGVAVTALALGRAYSAPLLDALNKKRLTGADLQLADRSSIAVLQQGLRSPQPGVVLAALDLLEQADALQLGLVLPPLLAHASPDVRAAALAAAERNRVRELLPWMSALARSEAAPRVRAVAVRALAGLGGHETADEVAAMLDDPLPEIRVAACAGLLRAGRADEGAAGPARARLRAWLAAPVAAERTLAARALAQSERDDLYAELLPLLRDQEYQVRIAALAAAGNMKNPALWPEVVAALTQRLTRPAAAALVAGGDTVLPTVRAALADPTLSKAAQLALVRVCARIDSSAAHEALAACINLRDEDVRTQVAQALARGGYRASGAIVGRVKQQIRTEIALAAQYTAALVDLEGVEAAAALRQALAQLVAVKRDCVFFLLALLYDSAAILRARHNLQDPSPQKRAYALEMLDLQTAPELRKLVLPLLEDLPAAERRRRLLGSFPQLLLGPVERLQWIAVGDHSPDPWVRACAVAALESLGVTPALLRPDVRQQLIALTTTVAALRQADIFAAVPGTALAEVAARVERVTVPAGRQLFAKGDYGASLYIISSGHIRIHDGERTLNELSKGQVFGEMALLDGAPRLAAATTLTETTLLSLAQEPLFEILAERGDVLRGIMGVLSQRLRARVQDLVTLQKLAV